MSLEQIIFYTFSAVLIFCAFQVITVRNPIHAALFLVLAFFTTAAIWLMLEAEFLAIVLVLVYVGAVMVLFLFVIMMLDINTAEMRAGFIKYLPVGAGVAVAMIIEMALVVSSGYFSEDKMPSPARHGAEYSNTKELGMILYTEYVYAFELAAVILLVAIVAAIALTLRRRPETRYINPGDQVAVKREDRVRLVKMTAEKKG